MASTSKANSANLATSQRSVSGSAPSPFFLKERERLITDIADVSSIPESTTHLKTELLTYVLPLSS